MNLRDFCSKFKVGVQRPYCNRIFQYNKNNNIVEIFYLKRNSDLDNKIYFEHYKFSLMKHKL